MTVSSSTVFFNADDSLVYLTSISAGSLLLVVSKDVLSGYADFETASMSTSEERSSLILDSSVGAPSFSSFLVANGDVKLPVKAPKDSLLLLLVVVEVTDLVVFVDVVRIDDKSVSLFLIPNGDVKLPENVPKDWLLLLLVVGGLGTLAVLLKEDEEDCADDA